MKIPNLMSARWLHDHFDDEKLIILDTSPRTNVSNLVADFPDLQIKSARYFDMEEVFFDAANELPNMFPDADKFEKASRELGIETDSMIVVYDNLGIYTAPRAWWMLKSMGHANVGVLDGGLTAWKKAGYACEPKHKAAYQHGDFEVRFNQDQVCDATWILDNLHSTAHVVVDARSPGRFSGTDPEPRPNMQSGHIPGSVNIPFRTLLEDGKMKKKDELKVIFDQLNIGGKTMVFTCGSGVTACIVLLAASQVNDNAKVLFDGSWASWGKGTRYPVDGN